MGKNILIVSATVKEIEPLLDKIRQHSGLVAGHTIDVLISGVGLVSATYHLTRQILLKRPALIIQAGIAGCFDKKTGLGTVVAVKQDIMGDEGVIESKQLKTIFDLKLVSKNRSPYSGGWLINKGNEFSKIKLKKVKAVSVNQVTTSKQSIQFYKDKFNPVIESMEGAALHYTCLSESIPFIQLRSVSNYIGERNKKNWKMKDAITNLNNELIKLLDNL